MHIVKKLLELCEVTLGDIFIQDINERLVFLIKLGRLPHGVDKLLYLLRIAVEHLHHVV